MFVLFNFRSNEQTSGNSYKISAKFLGYLGLLGIKGPIIRDMTCFIKKTLLYYTQKSKSMSEFSKR